MDTSDNHSSSQAEFDALVRWRARAIELHKLATGDLKDVDLRQVVDHGRKDVREIEKKLNQKNKRFASEIVDVLVSVTGSPAGAASSAASAATSPETITPASAAAGRGKPSRDQSQPVSALVNDASRFVPTKRIVSLPTLVALRIIELTHGLRLRWSAGADDTEPHAAYRAVSRDDYPPHSPESGQLVDVTDELSCLDLRLPTSAHRFYAIYRYGGPSVDEMFESQPVLVSTAIHVFGVQEATVEEDDGRVIGRWRALPGVDRVLVFRTPLNELHLSVPADERYQISVESDNLAGFVDKSAVRGCGFRYDFYVETTVGNETRRSDVVSVEHTVTARLSRVTDLEVVRHFDDHGAASFDLRWSRPPAGEVTIYRTETGPLPGATNEDHAVDALPQTKLDPAASLRLPIAQFEAGFEGILDVPGRLGWSRIHFTPVTVLDGRARVGETVTQLVVGELVRPEIVERCDHQVVKFGWPAGAANVVAVVRGLEDPLNFPRSGEHVEQIDAENYRRLGGLQLRRPLRPQGCALHLMGQAFEAGRSDFGPATVVTYPGLLRLWYTVEARQRLFKLDRVIVRISAEREVSPAPAFVLVHRPDRLPLHPHDGNPLELRLDLDTATTSSRLLQPDKLGPKPTSVGWSAAVRGLSGYIRLFVDQTQGRAALLDPPPGALALRP